MATAAPVSFTPGNSAGFREDLSRLAPRLIDPADAPVYKGLPRRDASAVLHEWLTDALPAVSALPTPPLFTAEPNYDTTLGRARKGNRIQHFQTTYSISEVSEIIAAKGGIGGGITSEVRREIERQLKFLSKQIEFTLLSEQTKREDDGSDGAKLGGFFKEVSTAVDDLGATTIVNGVSESLFQDKIEVLFNNGASAPIWAVMQPAMARIIGATWKGREQSRETITRGEHRIDTVVESYVAPVGGVVNITPNRTMGSGLALIDKSQAAISELSPVRVYERDPNSFQNRQGRISTYLTLDFGNEKAHGGWKNDSTPGA